jgi:agmatine deiminase
MKHFLLFLSFVFFSAASYTQIANPRAWAEFEETRGIIINQPYKWSSIAPDDPDWVIREAEEFDSIYVCLINETLKQEVDVYYLLDTAFATHSFNPAVLDTLYHRYGVDIHHPKFHVVEIDGNRIQPGLWIRDNGPMNVYQNKVDTLYSILFADDLTGTGKIISDYLEIPAIEITDPATGQLCSDGGNYMVDGNRMAIIDEGSQNDQAQLPFYASLFGLDTVHTIPHYLGHIDYYMKLVDEETLLISQQQPWNYTTGIEQYTYEEDVRFLTHALLYIQENVLSRYGRPLKIYPIPNAPSFESNTSGLTYVTTYASYVGSFIVNRVVFVPQYKHPETDAQALEIYRKAMPGYTIVPVTSRYLAEKGGTIHCITHSIATDEPIWIQHKSLQNVTNHSGNYEVTASIRTRSGVQSATVHWKTKNDSLFMEVPMHSTTQHTYTGYIPHQPANTQIDYFIESEANSGKKGRKPWVAPQGTYTFRSNGMPDRADLPVKKPSDPEIPVVVYPHPATHTLFFKIPETLNNRYKFRLYTLQGQKITEEKLFSSTRIQVSSLPEGPYLYLIQDTKTGRFISGKIWIH